MAPIDPGTAAARRDARPWRERHRRVLEVLVLAGHLLGTVLVVAGAVAATVVVEASFELGMAAAGAGTLLVTGSVLLGYRVAPLRIVYRKATGGRRYDQLKYWTRLKSQAILLNLLALLAGAIRVASLVSRVEPVQFAAPLPVVLRLTTLLALVLGLSLSVAHHMALRIPVERGPRSEFEVVFVLLGGVATLAFALVAAVLPGHAISVPGLAAFSPTDAPFFLLAGLEAASLTLLATRGVPTLYGLVAEERTFYEGRTYLSRSKSVVLPATIAFALLFLVLAFVMVLGLGLASLLEEIPRNAVLVGVFGFIIAAMMISVVTSVLLSRSEDRATLYRVKRSAEARRVITLLAASAAASTAFLVMAALLHAGIAVAGIPTTRWLDFASFGLLAALGPYGFLAARRARRVRLLEERFPDFLRDIAASRRAGLTMNDAVAIAARGDYGALTPEIVKLADQLSWNVPFDEALDRFGERVRTPLVQRAVALINEASRTGGNVTDVLLAAARDAREIKNLENERASTMGLYTAIIYIIMVFLAVAATLYGTFVPEILKASGSVLATGSTGFGGIRFGELGLQDYREFYFLGALVQGLGGGFVAGLMGTGKLVLGLRHAFFMVLIAYVAFAFLLPQ